MKTKSLLSELVVLLLLSWVPLPGPPVLQRTPCPSDRSSIVRNIVYKKWMPILQKYGLQLPIECPFHPKRDIFWPRQESKVRHRPSQWSCGLCGKSFYNDRFLERHFENRHPGHLNMAEDAVCLADYCDIMRCAVWEAAAASQFKTQGGHGSNTDLELWKDTNALVVANTVSHPSPTALQPVPITVSKDNAATFISSNAGSTASKTEKIKQQRSSTGPQHCNTSSRSKNKGSQRYGENNTDGGGGGEIDNSRCSSPSMATVAPGKDDHLNNMQRFKVECRPETLLPLQARCESLVWDCLAGLMTNLTADEFKHIESEMKRTVCWYLTCERYWENTPNERRKFPWVLLLVLVTGLALVICLCYYLIWLMCDSDDHGSLAREGSMSQPSSPILHARGIYAENDPAYYTENVGGAGAQGEHYIYVAYPPELKRRLMESCYNRTTRL